MRAELVFIPDSGVGHLTPTVETAKRIVDRDDRISITVLIIPSRHETSSSSSSSPHLQSLSDGPRLRYIFLQRPELGDTTPSPIAYLDAFKPQVRDAVSKLTESTRPDSPRLAGFVVDMFCVAMIDVANEFRVPSYMFYVSCAGFLGLQLHVQRLHDDENYLVSDLKGSNAELDVPCFSHPFPAKCLPSLMLNKDLLKFLLHHSSRFEETRGIVMNTFAELEPYALESFTKGNSNCPPVYPVAPVMKLKSNTDDESKGGDEKKSEIMKWLDDQPPKSVVFLCFGSMGGFNDDQIMEMARGIERSGHRFLWSVRRASAAAGMLTAPPGEIANIEEVLPEGFLDRTKETGRIIGWAPQLAVLAHPAVGGFVSHCGWNSVIESLWFGVPMATLPMYGEHQVIAFLMVVESGLAVEIKNDYRNTPAVGMVEKVTGEEIENGIRRLMAPESDVRKRVVEMSRKSREALMDGGSSHDALGKFILDVLNNNTS